MTSGSAWLLTPALELPLARLAQIFAACFEGYVAPVSADPAALATRVRAEHVDLAASVVAMHADIPQGIALVARRGAVARIAAMGAVPAARGRGLGRALLQHAIDQARARGERRMVLEVIEQNAPARALYERAGFVRARRLEGFVAPPLGGTDAGDAGLLAAHAIEPVIRACFADADDGLPWQLAPATLAAATLPTQAFAHGEALALVDAQPGAVVLRGLVVPRHARRRGHATRLLRALRVRFPDSALRVPAIVPVGLAGELAARIGAQRTELTQLELARDLAPRV